MDTTASNIHFDEQGRCNYCTNFIEKYNHDSKTKPSELEKLVEKIKKDGKNKEYDCIVGVSGGVDSSYVLYLVKQLGLRPLATHMDNGWDTELAANNIANLVRKLDVDLYTHVIDWEEYKDLMKSFFKADVIDIELLYDNALHGVNYRHARKYGVNYILSGNNVATEGIVIPKNWNWMKYDGKNIRAIQNKFGSLKIKSFPLISLKQYLYFEHIRNIKRYAILDYIDFKKQDALDLLIKDFNYKPYPYKHYESVFTRFYQSYILPIKFGVDKRKAHLSSLIASGQMTRIEALAILKEPPYNQRLLEEDIDYFIKKMDWTKADFEAYLKKPEIAHNEYASDIKLYHKLQEFNRKRQLKK